MEKQSEDYRQLGDESNLLKRQPRHTSRVKSAWYIYGHKDGRAYIVKASNEEEANRINFAKYDGNAIVEELPTIDLSTATQMIKAKWLRQGEALEEATRRAKHQV